MALTQVDTPAAPRPLAELRAERARVTAYLAELDQEIETAEALDAFGDMSAAELLAEIEAAERVTRLASLALARKGA